MDQRKLREQQVFKVIQTVSLMQYQPGQDYDYYYPSIQELGQLGTTDEDGHIEYSETDLAFLAWTMHPIDPENISTQQKQCMDFAAQLLQDYIEEPDDVLDPEEMKEILAQHQKKQTSGGRV